MDWLALVTFLGGLVPGGVVTFFMTLKYQRKRVIQEVRQVEYSSDKTLIDNIQATVDIQIKNAEHLIEMYKKGMSDLTEIHNQREDQYKQKIDDLQKQVNTLQHTNDELDKKVIELTDLVNKFKLEVESVRRLTNRNCDFCEFKDHCQKRAALRRIDSELTKLIVNQ